MYINIYFIQNISRNDSEIEIFIVENSFKAFKNSLSSRLYAFMLTIVSHFVGFLFVYKQMIFVC